MIWFCLFIVSWFNKKSDIGRIIFISLCSECFCWMSEDFLFIGFEKIGIRVENWWREGCVFGYILMMMIVVCYIYWNFYLDKKCCFFYYVYVEIIIYEEMFKDIYNK